MRLPICAGSRRFGWCGEMAEWIMGGLWAAVLIDATFWLVIAVLLCRRKRAGNE